jgi:phytoene synthase
MTLARTHDRDIDACAAMLRKGSISFHTASRLLPSDVRRDTMVLYAFCRSSDDAVDEADPRDGVTDPQQSLLRLQHRLRGIYDGAPADLAEDRAMVALVRKHHIPRAVLEALLEGFAWDAAERSYETIDDLHDYAVRVAGTVGMMMTMLMGIRSTHVLARACDLGVAMQLTNIARDVGQDARMGRLYLPYAWLRDEGLDPRGWLSEPTFCAPLGRVVDRLLRHADELYARAATGIDSLPRDCQTAIRAALLIYRDIGRTVRKHHLDSVHVRAVVPWWRKLWLVLLATLRHTPHHAPHHTPGGVAQSATHNGTHTDELTSAALASARHLLGPETLHVPPESTPSRLSSSQMSSRSSHNPSRSTDPGAHRHDPSDPPIARPRPEASC